ncbi:5'-nucleotidase C-terminal domain-containing protein [Parendozoicomonas haliclonae]|uniref:Trifunctional nucleotide phosphoesterase protein YfkN n=1 Tax=Parendozoicomonas haliclonae TaxID=1960125 RepID=A0A1X7AKB0_9GAMM|nr:5'-nucleotidase C-terminal domain-containing protein [Parendozoicomonas haliclonae]SMA47058.1 Trifunctional nucleotide phosphoesterase protein YfkN precursor [Parendozoicomonas haliclonae]
MAAKSPVINEFVFDHKGTDTNEFIEVLGDPLTDYSNLWLLTIEGDSSSSNLGKITNAFQLGSTDEGGFWTIEANNQLQNGTETILLVEGFTGSKGDSVDTDLDGELDSSLPFTNVVDSVAKLDSNGQGFTYSPAVLTPGFDGISYEVGGASRINGEDTDTANDFVRNDYDGDGLLDGAPAAEEGEVINTPGAANDVPDSTGPTDPTDPTGPAVKAIYEIQGRGHTSEYVGQLVATAGIVTAVDANGFYLQGEGDGDIATSDALFVFTNSTPTVSVGDSITLKGEVAEYIPGGASTGNLSTTQLTSINDLVVVSSGNALPDAVVIGEGGRELPTENVDDDGLTSYDPETDGIDFFESLEGMRVTIQDAKAVSATNKYGEIFTVADNGDNATGTNDRGGLALGENDLNPERVQIQFDNDLLPGGQVDVNVGDQLGNVTGVLDYNFGNYEVKATEAITVTPSGLQKDMTALTGSANELTVASYNVENLDAQDADARFEQLAQQIINNLGNPDILALQEIQDNDGASDSGNPSADQTWQKLIDAIEAAGGPSYEVVQLDPANNADGGQPGGNIRVGYLYNPDRVDYVEDSAVKLTDSAFDGTRKPLYAQFEFNGETVDLVNVHLSSKYGSTPVYGAEQPFINNGYEERMEQAQAINNFVDGILAENADANVMVLGDFNSFEWEGPADVIEGEDAENVMTNLIDGLSENVHTYNFQGNAQVLDQVLVSNNLAGSAELDIVHINSEFADQASDHDPLVAKVTIGEPAVEDDTFTLQILHASDLEGGVEAIGSAANFAAIVDHLEDTYSNSITLSAGDNYLTGPFFSASEDRSVFRDSDVFNDFYNSLYGLSGDESYQGLREGGGRVDISIMNAIGFDAAALGNHEFDVGTSVLADLLAPQYKGDGLADDRWVGSQFPYLSANLDFSNDPNLSGLATDEILPADAFLSGPAQNGQSVPKIAPATILEEGGEKIGVIGATTPLLAQISSPGGTTVKNGDDPYDMQALADVLQPYVDQLMEQGVNKIILVSHLQQIALEKELVQLLHGVDVVIAGGSDTLQADETDVLHDGDTAVEDYPFTTTNADGDPAVIVSTDGQYSYVGRLVIDFDAEGRIILDENGEATDVDVSGAYAATDDTVEQLWGSEDAFAEGTKGDLVQDLTDAVQDIVEEKDSNILGRTDVFLEGRREEVRTEETNIGNLTADANLAAAQAYDSSVMVSIKNGGGIRAPIGSIVGEADGSYSEQPPEANPATGKQAGDISQLDIENTLKFNNGLTLMTLTAEQLVAVLEHGVAASGEGQTPGQFAQVSGIHFSFDTTLEAGSRIRSAAIVNEQGEIVQVLVENGELAVAADMAIRIVTLNFLADGGDGYPFAEGTDVVHLGDVLTDTGASDFAAPGSEQDALAEYLLANFSDQPYQAEDTSAADDTRIQNLAEREDTVLQGPKVETDGSRDGMLVGAAGNDRLYGEAGDDRLDGMGGDDLLEGGSGDDWLFGREGDDTLRGDSGNDWLYAGAGKDEVQGGSGNDYLFGENGNDRLYGEQGNDELNGGKGNDLLHGGSGNDYLVGGNGQDQLFGAEGDDDLMGGKGNDLLDGGSGHDYLAGGSGNDQLFGEDGNDELDGGKGHDVLIGNVGHDQLQGGQGDDELWGGSHNDRLEGGAGDDRLLGGSGNDYLAAGAGDDWLLGGSGRDIFDLVAASGHNTVRDFEAGSDRLLLNGLDFTTLDDVRNASTEQGRNLVIALDDSGDNTLTLIGTSLDDLDDNNVGWEQPVV